MCSLNNAVKKGARRPSWNKVRRCIVYSSVQSHPRHPFVKGQGGRRWLRTHNLAKPLVAGGKFPPAPEWHPSGTRVNGTALHSSPYVRGGDGGVGGVRRGQRGQRGRFLGDSMAHMAQDTSDPRNFRPLPHSSSSLRPPLDGRPVSSTSIHIPLL
jgi:hypothetical protein